MFGEFLEQQLKRSILVPGIGIFLIRSLVPGGNMVTPLGNVYLKHTYFFIHQLYVYCGHFYAVSTINLNVFQISLLWIYTASSVFISLPFLAKSPPRVLLTFPIKSPVCSLYPFLLLFCLLTLKMVYFYFSSYWSSYRICTHIRKFGVGSLKSERTYVFCI